MQCGLGIRPEFVNQVLDDRPDLSFFEAHSENYFGDSLSRAKLLELAEHYPISLHGVGLSLGRADDLNHAHLQNLKKLVNDVRPLFVSEHLAWSAYAHQHVPDLLPLPLTQQSLATMCEHVEQMQQTLGRQVLVENPSNYLVFDQLQLPEPEFLNLLAQRTGCGLLVDINNIYVSAVNVGRDPLEYLQALNSSSIGQYHLAGYTEVQRDFGGSHETMLIDTHNQPVYEPVWNLFSKAIELHGPRNTIFEWDSDFPKFSVLLDECRKANILLDASKPHDVTSKEPINIDDQQAVKGSSLDSSSSLASLQAEFLNDVVAEQKQHRFAEHDHKYRISVYQNNFFSAMQSYLADVYPATKGVVGTEFFKHMVHGLLKSEVPSEGNIHGYGAQLVNMLEHIDGLEALPYLADLLRYEWALHAAYYCDMEGIVDPSVIPQEELLSLDLVYNNSVQLISSAYPIYEIHRQSLPSYEGDVAINLAQSQDDILVYKCQNEVDALVLSSTLFETLKSVKNTQNLLQAIEALGGSIATNELSSSLSFIFEKQLLCSTFAEMNSQSAIE